MKEKVSIALCTYNGAAFLPAQLESFTNQTRQPDELIVCDDGSTDETSRILEKFAAAAPFAVEIHRNAQNLGTVKNFEKAVSLCTGDLIFLSDQDDVWDRQKIARFCEKFAARSEVRMIFSNAELTDEKLAPLGVDLWDFYFSFRGKIAPQTDDFFERLLTGNIVTGATMAFRAAVRDSALPFPTDLPLTIHDGWLALAAAATGEVDFLDEKLVKYRQHGGQQIGVTQMKTTDAREDYALSIVQHGENLERLEKLGVMLETLPLFEKKRHLAPFVTKLLNEEREIIRHYKMRGAIGNQTITRLPRIVAELFSGRYHRFSKGFRSAAKDLLKK